MASILETIRTIVYDALPPSANPVYRADERQTLIAAYPAMVRGYAAYRDVYDAVTNSVELSAGFNAWLNRNPAQAARMREAYDDLGANLQAQSAALNTAARGLLEAGRGIPNAVRQDGTVGFLTVPVLIIAAAALVALSAVVAFSTIQALADARRLNLEAANYGKIIAETFKAAARDGTPIPAVVRALTENTASTPAPGLLDGVGPAMVGLAALAAVFILSRSRR